MIKRIPIKGISRNPSGEISTDGYCIESLNVQLESGEVSPMIKPQKLLDAAGSAIEVDGDILYIHKGGTTKTLSTGAIITSIMHH